MNEAGFVLLMLSVGAAFWLAYELATGQRQLVRFITELVIVYGPVALIFGAAAALNLALMFAVVPWVLFLLAGGRRRITGWLADMIPGRAPQSAPASLTDWDSTAARWEWAEDPTVQDPGYFADWFECAMENSGSGFYGEHLAIGADGRVDPSERMDGTIPMLPMYFHQFRVTAAGVSKRGPTVQEFRQLVATLQAHLPALEFMVEEDPEGRWIKYRVRR